MLNLRKLYLEIEGLQKGENYSNIEINKNMCEKLCGKRGQCVQDSQMNHKCVCKWPYFFNNPFSKKRSCDFDLWTLIGGMTFIAFLISGAAFLYQKHLKKRNLSLESKLGNVFSSIPIMDFNKNTNSNQW